jgi:hypothetical protein
MTDSHDDSLYSHSDGADPSAFANKGPRFAPTGPQSPVAGAVEIPEPEMVLLTGAYCPRGCQLILPDAARFDDHPGITLHAAAGTVSGTIVLSPIQGDHRKTGLSFPPGTLVTLSCPFCRIELPFLGPCACSTNGQYVGLYTVQVPDPNYTVGICRRWGCFRSFLKDAGRIVTTYGPTDPQPKPTQT